jgi:hypothetical protein
VTSDGNDEKEETEGRRPDEGLLVLGLVGVRLCSTGVESSLACGDRLSVIETQRSPMCSKLSVELWVGSCEVDCEAESG